MKFQKFMKDTEKYGALFMFREILKLRLSSIFEIERGLHTPAPKKYEIFQSLVKFHEIFH